MNPEPPPATPAPAGSKLTITLADLLVAGGALVILLFSWGRVVSYAGTGPSLWSWLQPLGIFVIVATLLLLVTAAIDTWWARDKQIAGLHRHHVQVGLALYVLVTIFGMMLAGGVGVGVGWGGIIQFLGALIAAGAALLNHFNLLQNQLTMPAGTSKPAAYGQPQGGTTYQSQRIPPAQDSSADRTTQLPPQQ